MPKDYSSLKNFLGIYEIPIEIPLLETAPLEKLVHTIEIWQHYEPVKWF